jgi:PAS domain S-box-containing protein
MSIFRAGVPWLVADRMRRGIGFRLLASVLLFSSLITFVLTAFQLYLDYRRGVDVIVTRLDEIEGSYLGSLGESLWNLDRRQLTLQLEGILRLPDIRAAEVREVTANAEPLVVAVGSRGETATLAREIPIVHVVQNEPRTIGHLYLEATLTEVYRELTSRALIILGSQGAKTFVVSLFILFIVHRLVTRHLVTVAGFVRSYDLRRPPPPLELQRRRPGTADELDQVVTSFNLMCASLQRAYDELRKANARLEQDIAVRRQTEDALRQSEQRFRDYAETASDWFWETGPDHRFTYLSERLAAFGINRPALIGHQRWDAAIDRADEPEKWRWHFRILERREPFRDLIYKVRHEDGSVGFVATSGKPVFDPGGRFVGYRGGGRDATATVRADQALREAKDLAEAASRAKSMFLANMSHELRTPLNAIIGMSEMIKTEMLGPVANPQYRSYAGDIHTSGLHLLGIINEILDLAKIEAGRMELDERELDLGVVVGEVLRIVAPQSAANGLVVESQLAPQLPHLRADEQAIRRILFNLLSNAFKFTPRNGKVTVTLRQAENADIELSVADTGIGIAAEDISKLMQPFVQLDNVYQRRFQGTGLGLALVRSLAQLHGGSISIESVPGRGTVVTVWLPAGRVVSQRIGDPSSRDDAARATSKKLP